MKNYVELEKTVHVTKETLAKFPEEKVWVDIWHVAKGTFSIQIRQSKDNFKNYWSDYGLRKIGFRTDLSKEEMFELCAIIHSRLEIPFENFEFHGSNLGDSKWLQKQIEQTYGHLDPRKM